MTREKLESYQSMKDEIRELRYKIEHLGKDGDLVGNNTIMDYRSGYPVPQAVVAVNRRKYWNLHDTYTKRIEKLEKDCQEVVEFIEAIENSMTRRIYRMYYIDGMSQLKIAKTVHISQAAVSRKLQNLKIE